jgi:outer membrane immunogenic protein
MKHLVLALAATTLLSGAALAADLPAYEPAPLAVASPGGYDWTGFYVGLQGGGIWGDVDTDTFPLPSPAVFGDDQFSQSTDLDGFLGGLEAGFNWQSGMFVFGVEGDISAANVDGNSVFGELPLFPGPGTDPGSSQTVDVDMNWFGTLRVRAGITPMDRVLLFASGGLAVADVDYTVVTDYVGAPFRYPGSSSDTEFGWTIGGGAEVALGSRWTVKAEYLYFDLGDETIVANPVAPNPPFQVQTTQDITGHLGRVGVNFRF